MRSEIVERGFIAFGLQLGVPSDWQGHLTLSTDPFSVEKVRDIIGLYLSTAPSPASTP